MIFLFIISVTKQFVQFKSFLLFQQMFIEVSLKAIFLLIDKQGSVKIIQLSHVPRKRIIKQEIGFVVFSSVFAVQHVFPSF